MKVIFFKGARRFFLAALALLLAFACPPIAAADGGANGGPAFVYRDPPQGDSYTTRVRYGLMGMDGQILLEAAYDYGFPLALGIQDRPDLFYFYEQASGRAFLYDVDGKQVAKGDYQDYDWLSFGLLQAVNQKKTGQAFMDLYDGRGQLIHKAVPGTGILKTASGYLTWEYIGGDENTLHFLDEGYKEYKQMKVRSASPYDESGLARQIFPFEADKGSGYMDDMGRVVIEPQYVSAESFGTDGRAVVTRRKDKRCTLIDRAGKELLPYEQHSIAHNEDCVILYTRQGQRVLDGKFAPLSDTLYESASLIHEKAEGTPDYLCVAKKNDGGIDLIDKDGVARTIDSADGIELLPGNRALTTRWGGSHGVLDLATMKEIPIQGDYLAYYGGERIMTSSYTGDPVDGHEATLVDLSGKVLLRAFDLMAIGEDRIIVHKRRFGVLRYGLADLDGKEILPCVYSYLAADVNSPAWPATKGGKTGYIDPATGEFIYAVSVHGALAD